MDLDPVAHIIELCTLVYPQRYGKRLADDVENWGQLVKNDFQYGETREWNFGLV